MGSSKVGCLDSVLSRTSAGRTNEPCRSRASRHHSGSLFHAPLAQRSQTSIAIFGEKLGCDRNRSGCRLAVRLPPAVNTHAQTASAPRCRPIVQTPRERHTGSLGVDPRRPRNLTAVSGRSSLTTAKKSIRPTHHYEVCTFWVRRRKCASGGLPRKEGMLLTQTRAHLFRNCASRW